MAAHADANDIVKALQFAFNHSLKTAVLGAGHQVVGVQLLPGGVTIDTSTLRNVTIDPDSETAYAQPGLHNSLTECCCCSSHAEHSVLMSAALPALFLDF